MQGLHSSEKEAAAFQKAVEPGRPGERALTDAIGHTLGCDLAAAGRFAALLVAQLRPEFRVPKRLACTPEHSYFGGVLQQHRQRRADLIFWNPAADYALVVEAKLRTHPGRKQISDGLKIKAWNVPGLRKSATIHFVLIANQAMVPRDKTGSQRWLGATTWGGVVDEMSRVPFEDAAREQRWRQLFGSYRDRRAFGVDESAPAARDVLDAIALPLVRSIDKALRRNGGSARAIPAQDPGIAVVRATTHGATMSLLYKTKKWGAADRCTLSLALSPETGLATVRIGRNAQRILTTVTVPTDELASSVASAVVRVARED